MLDMMLTAQRNYYDFWSRAWAPVLQRTEAAEAAFRNGAARPSGGALVPVPIKTTNQEETIAVGEEQLDVTTRRVTGEATRVRRIVKEMPVERRVELHDETVIIERRAPNGRAGNGEALEEREYLLVETREVPVATKRVVLKEELVVRRQTDKRVETIRDTLRQADVQVIEPQRMVTLHEKRDHKDQRDQKTQHHA
jgi:stress response protein YsnF